MLSPAFAQATDTVKSTDHEALGGTVDRAGLLAVTSPVVLPASVVDGLDEPPPTAAFDDLATRRNEGVSIWAVRADLVAWLRAEHEVLFVEAPPAGRRVTDESDLRLVEALSSDAG